MLIFRWVVLLLFSIGIEFSQRKGVTVSCPSPLVAPACATQGPLSRVSML